MNVKLLTERHLAVSSEPAALEEISEMCRPQYMLPAMVIPRYPVDTKISRLLNIFHDCARNIQNYYAVMLILLTPNHP